MSTNTSVMDGYTKAIAALPQEAFLGSLLYFSISNADVELDKARQQLSALGLSTDRLRKNLRPVDAFSKAARDCGRKFHTTVDDVKSELLVRALGQDSEQVVTQLILERAEWKGGKKTRRLLFHKVAELTFNRGKKKDGDYIGHSVETLRTTDGIDLTLEEDGWLSLTLQTFADHYNHNLTHLDSHAVRTFVREYINGLSGVCVKESGGLYFVRQDHASDVSRLATWVRGVGSQFHYLPLLNLAEQRAEILAAFEDEAVQEVERLMGEVKEILSDPARSIEDKTFDNYALKAAELKKKLAEYTEMLGARADRASIEIDMYAKQIVHLMNRIKTKPRVRAAS